MSAQRSMKNFDKMMLPRTNAVDDVKELATYIRGMADASDNGLLAEAAEWLKQLSSHVCGQGYIGCNGGRECSSDHK